MQKQKGFIQILVIALVVVVVAGFGIYYLLNAKPKVAMPVSTGIAPRYVGSYQQAAGSVTPINNSSDLNKVSADLNSSNTAQIDTELNKLSSTSLGF